ncbi:MULTISPECIES: DUF5053 domain-containing protein [Prevotella]|jgi:hypothetical protein|uniref:DUF5053 domain-containing protein n=2 Tax=Prevotella melaninogenica TaxID=28132 RepID=A0ABS6Y290_9BACT|nr:DUF5053 domain-containing protein [Prevotella melaninogenica]MBW4753607.1 DUF5053 domain-containing protein [Prevotella melaninogenica]DAS52270.1 MAG TPA: protein of unknown function (DUF5053) [Caudoviricetes sp.]
MAETTTMERTQTMYQQLADIDDNISWGAVAKEYFNKSASWFYHKMDGIDGNRKPTEFNLEERIQLKGALCDLADRIRRAADRIETT